MKTITYYKKFNCKSKLKYFIGIASFMTLYSYADLSSFSYTRDPIKAKHTQQYNASNTDVLSIFQQEQVTKILIATHPDRITSRNSTSSLLNFYMIKNTKHTLLKNKKSQYINNNYKVPIIHKTYHH